MGDYGADLAPDEDRIRQVAFGYLIAPLPNLKVDQHSTADSNKCYHLVRKFLSSNLWVLVDPTDIPGP